MEIRKKQDGEKLEICIEGRLDTNSAPVLQKSMEELLEEPVRELVLDLEGGDYVASSGLRVILCAQKKMNSLSGSMVVRNVPDEVMEVFEMTGFSDILDFA